LQGQGLSKGGAVTVLLGAAVNNNYLGKKLCPSITLRRRSGFILFKATKICVLRKSHQPLVFKPPYSTARGSFKREAETCTSVFRSRRGQCSTGLTSTSTNPQLYLTPPAGITKSLSIGRASSDRSQLHLQCGCNSIQIDCIPDSHSSSLPFPVLLFQAFLQTTPIASRHI
jgi:hypothetical protein